MKRLVLFLILVLLALASYMVIWEGFEKQMPIQTYTYKEVEAKHEALNTEIATLNDLNGRQFNEVKQSINDAVKLYEDKKSEYEALAQEQRNMAFDSTDLYDLDFIWTKVGNYASSHNVVLKLDIIKSATARTESNEYIICDLDFMCIGEYIGITDFIYDVEDDDRFKFEISEFNMVKPNVDEIMVLFAENTPKDLLEKKTQATFKVKNLPINSKTFTEMSQEVQEATNEIEGVVTEGPSVTQANS